MKNNLVFLCVFGTGCVLVVERLVY